MPAPIIIGGRRGICSSLISASGPLSLTNNQKLSLPPTTPVGTQVNVTDAFSISGSGSTDVDGLWFHDPTQDTDKTAYTKGPATATVWIDLGGGLRWTVIFAAQTLFYSDEDVAQPWLVNTWTEGSGTLPFLPVNPALQQLNTPNATITAMAVLGAGSADANAICTSRGTNDDKEYYNILGTPDDPFTNAITWVAADTAWFIYAANGDPRYFSLDDVETPDLVTTWAVVTGSLPAPTVSPIQQGELDAGAWVQDAGTATANAAYPVSMAGPNEGRQQYLQLSTTLGISLISGDWYVNDPDTDVLYKGSTAAAFPWGAGIFTVETGTPPAPTVVRDDVASESNWGPVTP